VRRHDETGRHLLNLGRVVHRRPISFSVLRNSIITQAFQPRHKKTFKSDTPLWRESSSDWLHEIDGQLRAALGNDELHALLAVYVPLGKRATLQERAALAAAPESELKRVKGRAYKVLARLKERRRVADVTAHP